MTTNKRDKILDTSLELFVTKGFHSVSTASIAKQAGVATGTLFHHFPTKNALLEALLITVKQEFSDAIVHSSNVIQAQQNANIKQQAKSMWFAGLDWAVSNPQKLQLFLEFSQLQQVENLLGVSRMKSLLAFLYHLIDEGLKQSIIKPYSEELLTEWCHSQFLATARYLVNQPVSEKEEIQEATFTLFWDSICKHD